MFIRFPTDNLRSGLFAGLCAFLALSAVNTGANAPPNPHLVPVEYGIDRSNMGTQWTLGWPSEPNVSPFLSSEYNKPGNFEARRVAVFDGIARLHPQWFRDGFGGPLFVDALRQVHTRGMKMLAIAGPANSDYDKSDYIPKERSKCQWGTYPLSKIHLDVYRKRLESELQAVKDAQLAVEAFEIGNELDLYCNDADSPTGADWAQHQWKWFLTPAQVQTFVKGYAPFLETSAAAIRKYFPKAKIITFGISMPAATPLIQALASVKDEKGKIRDYTELVDGYGSHIYPTSDTTLDMVQGGTASLAGQAAVFPHAQDKPVWITEWNVSGSSFWNGRPWYFQYDAKGQLGGDLNKADPKGVYPAMGRGEAIRTFQRDVVERLRSSPTNGANIGYVLYYSYDSAAKSALCDKTGFNRANKLDGICVDGVINPVTGDLLPGVAAAVVNAPRCPGISPERDTVDRKDCPK